MCSPIAASRSVLLTGIQTVVEMSSMIDLHHQQPQRPAFGPIQGLKEFFVAGQPGDGFVAFQLCESGSEASRVDARLQRLQHLVVRLIRRNQGGRQVFRVQRMIRLVPVVQQCQRRAMSRQSAQRVRVIADDDVGRRADGCHQLSQHRQVVTQPACPAGFCRQQGQTLVESDIADIATEIHKFESRVPEEIQRLRKSVDLPVVADRLHPIGIRGSRGGDRSQFSRWLSGRAGRRSAEQVRR